VSNKRASRAKAVNKPALFLAVRMCTCSRSGGLASQMGALCQTGCVSSVFGSVQREDIISFLVLVPFKGASRLACIDMRLESGTD
jgi:hypothetical protein